MDYVRWSSADWVQCSGSHGVVQRTVVTKNIFSDITPLSDNCGLATDILSTAGHLGQLLPTSNENMFMESPESLISQDLISRSIVQEILASQGAGPECEKESVRSAARSWGQSGGPGDWSTGGNQTQKIYIPVLIFQTIIFTFFSYLLEEKLCKKYKQT